MPKIGPVDDLIAKLKKLEGEFELSRKIIISQNHAMAAELDRRSAFYMAHIRRLEASSRPIMERWRAEAALNPNRPGGPLPD